MPDGAKLGLPCLHLYAIPTMEGGWPGMESLCDHLKGRDRSVALALESVGLVPRVVPYVFETSGGDSWRLHRQANAREKQIFSQKRLKGSSLERRLPIEFHAEFCNPDDVTWLARPPGSARIERYPTDAPNQPLSCSGKPNTARRTTSATSHPTPHSTPPQRSSSRCRQNPRGSGRSDPSSKMTQRGAAWQELTQRST